MSRKRTLTVRARRIPPCPAWSGISPWTHKHEWLDRIAPRIIETQTLPRRQHGHTVGLDCVLGFRSNEVFADQASSLFLAANSFPIGTYSAIAQAIPQPSYVEVPLPNSSIKTSESGVAVWNENSFRYIKSQSGKSGSRQTGVYFTIVLM